MNFEITKVDNSQIEQNSEEVPLMKRIDFINDNLLYKGFAEPGVLPSSPSWRIIRITIGNDGDVTEEYADGNANYDNVWNNRTILSYS